MKIPTCVLMGFAAWTLHVLMGSVGVYRWTRILSGHASIREWTGCDLDGLALAFLAARIGQSLVHITMPQTERIAALRFGLYFVQVFRWMAMSALVVVRA